MECRADVGNSVPRESQVGTGIYVTSAFLAAEMLLARFKANVANPIWKISHQTRKLIQELFQRKMELLALTNEEVSS